MIVKFGYLLPLLLLEEYALKTIKIYANRLNIGFDETDSIEKTQSINLSEKDYEENAIINPLRFVKFQIITNITVGYIYIQYIFFSTNKSDFYFAISCL